MKTEHFSIIELEKSATAEANGIDNSVPAALLSNAKLTLDKMEAVRAWLHNKPITISSGYRSPVLNKKVKGSATSAHCQALAVDFTCKQFGSPRDIVNELKTLGLLFDQLILENPDTDRTWVHIGFKLSGNRGQVLTKFSNEKTYRVGVH